MRSSAESSPGRAPRRTGSSFRRLRRASPHLGPEGVRRALKSVATASPDLAEQLSRSIRTGTTCRFDRGPGGPFSLGVSYSSIFARRRCASRATRRHAPVTDLRVRGRFGREPTSVQQEELDRVQDPNSNVDGRHGAVRQCDQPRRRLFPPRELPHLRVELWVDAPYWESSGVLAAEGGGINCSTTRTVTLRIRQDRPGGPIARWSPRRPRRERMSFCSFEPFAREEAAT